jgi:hypothetical protein
MQGELIGCVQEFIDDLIAMLEGIDELPPQNFIKLLKQNWHQFLAKMEQLSKQAPKEDSISGSLSPRSSTRRAL